MRSRFVRGALAALAAIALMAGMAVPATAVTFSYSQATGFLLDLTLPTPTANADPLGGLEMFGPVGAVFGPPPGAAPASVYEEVGWGCKASDGSNCAGVGVNVVATSPFSGVNSPDRSALRIEGVATAATLAVPGTVPGFLTGPLTGITAPIAPLGVGQIIPGTISDDGDWVFLTHLLHRNQPIRADAKDLSTALIRSTLRVSSLPPTTDPNDVLIASFTETLNTPSCSPPNPLGSTCDDRFTFDVGAVSTPLLFSDLGITYQIDFDLFTNDAGVAFDGSTVFTAENDTNDIWVVMRLQRVPAPSSLVLLGLALIAVAGIHLRGHRHTRK